MTQSRPGSSAPAEPLASAAVESSAFASEETLEALQYFETLELVAAFARTDLGRQQVRDLRPSTDPHDRRHGFEALQQVQTEDGPLVPSLEIDFAPLRAHLAAERVELEVEDLLAVGALLTVTEELLDALAGEHVLGAEAARIRASEAEEEEREELRPLRELRDQVRRVLDSRGRVRDDASPRLQSLRQRARSERDSLYSTLSRYTQEHAANLAEDTVTSRDGRLSVLLSAGSRGRMPGLVHGRSGTGKSFYFEPMEVVEANNALQAATSEEDAERRRLVRELEVAAVRRSAALATRLALLAWVDALQAAVQFAEQARGVLPHLGAERVRILGHRHPLLEPALATLRENVLGVSQTVERLVPLDLDFAEDRVLVITGPNAGGKTVALKSLGLVTALAYAGLPVPALEGTQLPWVECLVAAVGDEQSLLEGRSTFSAQLLGIKHALERAGSRSLILLDEVGSGTNPEEGSALACALLEELAASESLALLTTHLVPVAALATELDQARSMAMEFDADAGFPTFQLVSGAPGGSHALELAVRLELPERLLRRADELLGAEHRKLRSLIAENEALQKELGERAAALQSEHAEVARRTEELGERIESLEAQRRKVREEAQREVDAFKAEIRGAFDAEAAQLKEEHERGRRKELGRRAAQRIFERSEPKLPEVAPDRSGPSGPPEVGDPVRHKALGWQGVLESLDGDKAVVSASGKKLRCRLGELERTRAAKPKAKKRSARTKVVARAASHVSEINLIGKRVEPAIADLDAYLDHATLGGLERVRVIHGHGSGTLRNAVREFLGSHPAVASHAPGEPSEGGNGATVVFLRG